MQTKALLVALAAGIASALGVALAVVALALVGFGFSLALGVPAVVVAGVTVFALVLAAVEDLSPRNSRLAVATGVAGVAFLVVLAGSVFALALTYVVGLLASIVISALAAVATYLVQSLTATDDQSTV
jgi:hypothetical protein